MGSKGKSRFNALTAVSVIGSVVTGFLIIRMIFPIIWQFVPFVSSPVTGNRFRNIPGVEYYDLINYQGNANGWQTGDRAVSYTHLKCNNIIKMKVLKINVSLAPVLFWDRNVLDMVLLVYFCQNRVSAVFYQQNTAKRNEI